MQLFKGCVSGLLFLLIMSQVFPAEAKPPLGGHKAAPGKAKVDTKWEKKADKNRDGIVDPKEMRRRRQAIKKGKSEVDTGWEKKADKNQDGIIDAKELENWRQRDKKRKSKVDTRWEKKADKNRDGIVDAKELRKSSD